MAKYIDTDEIRAQCPEGYDYQTWCNWVDGLEDNYAADVREIAKDEIEDAYAHGYTEAESKYRETLQTKRENVRAQWVLKEDGPYSWHECPKCGYTTKLHPVSRLTNYCPNCGCQMFR